VWTVTDDDVIEIRPLEERRVGPRRGKGARGLPPRPPDVDRGDLVDLSAGTAIDGFPRSIC
jgi:hypothetical protein